MLTLGRIRQFVIGDSASLDAGAGFTGYAWNTNQSTQTIQATTSGTYSVTVEDQNGCHNSDTADVTVNALPSVDLGPDVSYCAGSSVTLQATTSNNVTSYAWSTGETTASIQVSSPGTYSLTVTNSDGCSSSDTIEVTENQLPVVGLGPGCLDLSWGFYYFVSKLRLFFLYME